MDIEHLRAFVQVVEHGSFAAVARRLNIAPSAVTRAVAALEDELGVRLLQRTTRRVSLTEAGSAYHARVRRIVEELDVASDDAKASSGQVRGPLRVTASVAYGQTVLVGLLPRLHVLHPGLEVQLLLTDAVVDLVEDRIDVALRLGEPADTSLVGSRLAPVRYRVCASPEYLARQGRPSTPAELTRHDCLRLPFPGFRVPWRFRDAAGTIETVDVRGWLTASTALALHRAALDGLGPVMLADWLVDPDLAAGRLVNLFPDHDATATGFDSAVWVLYASREHVPARVRAFVDFIKAQVSALPAR